MNAAIITARAGSKSIKNKNMFKIKNIPLIGYVIKAAKEAKKIDKIYISTDSKIITDYGLQNNCVIIERPVELRGDEVNHGDVIKHAVEYVDKIEENLENVVLLLGNSVMIDGNLIDDSLNILDEKKDIDSVMTVWKAADDHPLRALSIKNGLIESYNKNENEVSTNRQSYPKAYYYDQGIWAFRKDCVKYKNGPGPWWWMGKRCYPIIRNWITGRDIHTLLDVSISEWWIENLSKIKKL